MSTTEVGTLVAVLEGDDSGVAEVFKATGAAADALEQQLDGMPFGGLESGSARAAAATADFGNAAYAAAAGAGMLGDTLNSISGMGAAAGLDAMATSAMGMGVAAGAAATSAGAAGLAAAAGLSTTATAAGAAASSVVAVGAGMTGLGSAGASATSSLASGLHQVDEASGTAAKSVDRLRAGLEAAAAVEVDDSWTRLGAKTPATQSAAAPAMPSGGGAAEDAASAWEHYLGVTTAATEATKAAAVELDDVGSAFASFMDRADASAISVAKVETKLEQLDDAAVGWLALADANPGSVFEEHAAAVAKAAEATAVLGQEMQQVDAEARGWASLGTDDYLQDVAQEAADATEWLKNVAGALDMGSGGMKDMAKVAEPLADKLKRFSDAMGEAKTKAEALKKSFEEKGFMELRNGLAAVSAGLLLVSGASVKVASDVNETKSAMGVAFGDGSKDVEKWVGSMASELGRGEQVIRENVTSLDLMIEPLIGSSKASEQLSKSFTTLAVDMGSLLNTSDADALQALKSGLTGEAEPLKKFGLAMTEASLNAYMLEHGIHSQMQALSESDKVKVRAAFMLEKLSYAQGDATATADSFANAMKRIEGGVGDLAGQFGDALLPAAAALASALGAVVGWFKGLGDTTKEWLAWGTVAVGVVAGLAAGFLGVVAVLPSILAGMSALGLTFAGMAATAGAVALPVLAIAAGVAGLALLMGALSQAWDAWGGDVMDILHDLGKTLGVWMGKVGDGFLAMADVGMDLFNAWKDSLFDFVESAVAGLGIVATALEKVGLKSAGASLKGWAESAMGGLETGRKATSLSRDNFKVLAGVAEDFGKEAGSALSDWGSSAGSAVKDGLVTAGDAVKNSLLAAGDGIAKSFASFKGMVGLGGADDGDSDAIRQQKADAARKQAGELLGGVKPDDKKGKAKAEKEAQKRFDKMLREQSDYANHTAGDEYKRASAEEEARLKKQAADEEAAAKFEKEMAELQKSANEESAKEAKGAQKAETAHFEELAKDWSSFTAPKVDTRTWSEKLSDWVEGTLDSLGVSPGLSQSIGSALGGFAQKAVSKAGGLGGVVDAGIKGGAMGGPVGAAVGVGLELLSQSEEFQKLSDMLGKVVQKAADAFGKLLVPLEPLIGAVGVLVDGALKALAPLFGLLDYIIKPLVAPLAMLGDVLGALAPLFELMLKPLGFLMTAVGALVNTVLPPLIQMFVSVGQMVLGILVGLGQAWNGIVGAVQGVFRSLGDISLLGGHPFAFLNDWADGLESAKVTTKGLEQSLSDLEKISKDEAKAKADAAAAQLKQTKAVNEATRAFLNVPDAFRYAARAAEAAAPEPMDTAGGGGGGEQTPATGGGGYGPPSDSAGGGGGEFVQTTPAAAPRTSPIARRTAEDKQSRRYGDGAPLAYGPALADGGLVTGPVYGATIGEGGEAEVVAPLSRAQGMFDEAVEKGLARHAGGGGGGITNVFHVTIVSNNPVEIWKKIQALQERGTLVNTGAPLGVGPR